MDAVETVDLNDAPDSGRPYLPQRSYVAVITDAKFGQSKSSGNNMITLEFEVVLPKRVVFKGEDVITEGAKITDFLSLQPQALGKLKSLHKVLGLPSKLNVNNPDTTQYLGKAIEIVVRTEGKVMTIEGTNEPILVNGKPISDNNYRIVRYSEGRPDHNRSVAF